MDFVVAINLSDTTFGTYIIWKIYIYIYVRYLRIAYTQFTKWLIIVQCKIAHSVLPIGHNSPQVSIYVVIFVN